MQSIIEKGLRWLVIGGVFALPFLVLYVANDLFFPFITGKNFAFRIIVEIIGFAYLALALVNPAYRPAKTWLLAAFAAFLVIIGIADLQGVNAFKSIWSNFERMEGWVTLAHLFVLFVVASSVLTTEKLWRAFFLTSIGISVLVCITGLLQLAGVVRINQGDVRLDARFGNAIYLAVYLLIHFFLTALMWAKAWVEGSRRKLWTLILVPTMLLQLVILFFTASRGAIIGTIGGIILTCLILTLLARNSRNVWRLSAGVFVLALVFVGGIFLAKDSAFVQNSEPLRRITSISIEELTIMSRILNMQMAWQGFQERPFLGWGQENYNFVFNKYYDPRMYAQEQWFDRTHNIFFDWLIAGGILGLLGYLSLFVLAVLAVWRSGAFSIPEKAVLSGLFAAYAFNNLTVFDNITSYIFFVMILAYIAVRVSQHRGTPKLLGNRFVLPGKTLPLVGAVALVLGISTAFAVNSSAYAANKALIQAVAPQPTLQDNIRLFEESISYGSYGTQEAREQLVQGAIGIVGNPQVPEETRRELFEAARDQMTLQAEAVPMDARFPFFLGALYGAAGDAVSAEEWLRRAMELSPNKQSIRYQLGLNLVNAGKFQEAIAVFKEAYELLPSNNEALAFYALAAIRANETALADSLVAELVTRGAAADERVIGSYVAMEQYEKIVDLWEMVLANDPDNLQAQFGIAAAHYAAGNNAAAIAQLRKIESESTDPSARAQATDLIRQINDGTLQLQ